MQYYTPPHHLALDLQQAVSEVSAEKTYRNFLFLMPASVSELERSIAMVAAKRMAGEGYVYMALAGQREMEDRDGIRFLPLNTELPSFGLMTTVVVLHDQDLAKEAMTTYPDAQVFLLNPKMHAETQEEAMEQTLCQGHYFCHQHPWLIKDQIQQVHHDRRATVISIPAAVGDEVAACW